MNIRVFIRQDEDAPALACGSGAKVKADEDRMREGYEPGASLSAGRLVAR